MPTKKHVLQVIPALHGGGAERSTIEVAEQLYNTGIKSSIASSGGLLSNELFRLNCMHHRLPLDSKNLITIVRNARRLSRIIRERGVSLIHVRSRAPAWSVLLASRSTGIPYISTFHGLYGYHNAAKRLYNSAMLRGVACIAVSEFIEKHIYQQYPWATNIKRINRGVDTEYFKPNEVSEQHESNEQKEKTGADQNFTLLFPARFTRLKGHETLIAALRLIKDIQLNIILVGNSVGREVYLNALEQQFSELPHQITVHDHQTDLRPLYEQADVVLSASRKPESFGRTVVEAQAMQRLVIAPDQGANQDIIAPELQEGLFTVNDPRSLADAIRRLHALNPEQKQEMVKAGREHVKNKFQLQHMTEKTLELYEQLWQDYATLTRSASNASVNQNPHA